ISARSATAAGDSADVASRLNASMPAVITAPTISNGLRFMQPTNETLFLWDVVQDSPSASNTLYRKKVPAEYPRQKHKHAGAMPIMKKKKEIAAKQ
ncbi:MAG TPA: hypothetical protein VMJ94_01185, partial [Nitrososphaera sp.]|nr:hypothetical protein [Nitrososphaera sp.]